jgi:hypothetical protein
MTIAKVAKYQAGHKQLIYLDLTDFLTSEVFFTSKPAKQLDEADPWGIVQVVFYGSILYSY